jgi:hypothetical protein
MVDIMHVETDFNLQFSSANTIKIQRVNCFISGVFNLRFFGNKEMEVLYLVMI